MSITHKKGQIEARLCNAFSTSWGWRGYPRPEKSCFRLDCFVGTMHRKNLVVAGEPAALQDKVTNGGMLSRRREDQKSLKLILRSKPSFGTNLISFFFFFFSCFCIFPWHDLGEDK